MKNRAQLKLILDWLLLIELLNLVLIKVVSQVVQSKPKTQHHRLHRHLLHQIQLQMQTVLHLMLLFIIKCPSFLISCSCYLVLLVFHESSKTLLIFHLYVFFQLISVKSTFSFWIPHKQITKK